MQIAGTLKLKDGRSASVDLDTDNWQTDDPVLGRYLDTRFPVNTFLPQAGIPGHEQLIDAAEVLGATIEWGWQDVEDDTERVY